MIKRFVQLLILFVSLSLETELRADSSIFIEKNMAKPLNFTEKVSEIFVSNPNIADIQMHNPQVAYLYAKTPGQTSVIVINDKGEQLADYRVVVTHNLEQIQTLVEEAAPNDYIEVRSVPGGIIVEGTAESPSVAENVKEIVERFLGTDQIFINHVGVRAPVQVNLRVRIAEVNRTVMNNLGFNWRNIFSKIGDHFDFGFLQGRGITDAKGITSTEGRSALGASYSDSKNDINAVIDALSKEGLVTILAEPNLVSVSGETASFLAGGEFPYPVPQDDGTITIEFKQFGVSLSFTPTVLNNRLISMRVRPEVSELDESRKTEVGNFVVPAITTRRVETTVELGSGQSFALAGLIRNRVASDIDGTPGIADLPILGALFRSNAFKREETELVIVVTPYLVNPVSGKEIALPTDGLDYATFVEQVMDRKLNNGTPPKGQNAPLGGAGTRLMGPAGFAIE